MKVRKVTLVAFAIVAAGAVPALAGPALPIITHVDPENGRVGAGVGTPAHPIAAAGVDTQAGTVCGGLSYQTTQCVDLTDGTSRSAAAAPDLPIPDVSVDVDPSDGSVGVGTGVPGQPLVGVRYNTTNGTLCAGFSYQVPFCVQVGNN